MLTEFYIKWINFQHSDVLYAGFPKTSQELYLHILEMKSTINCNSIFEQLIFTSHAYGILTTNQFPEIPSYPIFMNDEEITINVKTNIKVGRLTEIQIQTLKKYHEQIFEDIVKNVKAFTVYDTLNSYLCVPSKKI